MTFPDFALRTLAGTDAALSDFAGKALLVVNTASRCGFTPQLAGLETLYATYRERGLVVLGFPSNQFAGQEPGTAEEIAEFCERTYGVTFPLFDKTDVNGPSQHPLFARLTQAPDAEGTAGDVTWNFEKFLITPDGQVSRFRSGVAPDDPALIEAIEAALPDAARTPRIGVRFEPDWAPEELPAFARWAEETGFDEIWFSEDLPWAGGIAMVATALACTETISVGIGLLPAVTRNVATTAMEIAALARIAPGRLIVALGHGIPSWMDQIGAGTPRRFTALEETTTALRALLAGDTVTVDGFHVHLDGVRLGFPPAQVPPILLGTTGPTGLAITGRSSDGVVLPEIAPPAAVRWAREEMAASGPAATTVLFAMTSLGDDRDKALAPLRARMQRLIDFRVFDRLTEIAGMGADGSGELTDAILQSITVGGTPADGARAIQDWAAAGTDTIVLVAGADDPVESYRRFADDVFPLIGRPRG